MTMGQSWQIGRIFGIPLKVHVSWFLVFLLVAWSLAEYYFPAVLTGSSWQYWGLGIVAALLLFGSVLVHELGHCIVASAYRIPIAQITLFIFGGMAQIRREAPSPKAEFLIAIAGPIVSVLIAFGFWGITLLPGATSSIIAVSEHLRNINLILAAFNLVPGYPLDGGRVLRAGLWAWSRNFHKATRYAARAGQGVGVLLVLFGLWDLTIGMAVGGMWFMLIGVFLYTSAHNSHRQVTFKESLAGLRIAEVMTPEVVVLEPGDSITQAVNQFFLRHGYGAFPVVEQGRLVGTLSLDEVKALPRETWETTTVGQAMVPQGAQSAISPEQSLELAMDRMVQEDRSRLIVTEGDKVVGVISRSGIGRFLELMQR
jgi:Zn-dependent protease/predicted transcriptional regulator